MKTFLKKNFLAAGILGLGLTACSTVAPGPDWLDTGATKQYPDKLYVTASGCGKNLLAAQAEARQAIAQKLITTVDSSTTTESIESVETNGNPPVSEKRSVNSHSISLSNVVLAGLSYPKVFHRSAHQVCVLGVENKARARMILLRNKNYMKSLIRKINRPIHNKLKRLQRDIEMIEAFNGAQRDSISLGLLRDEEPSLMPVPKGVMRAYAEIKRLAKYRIELKGGNVPQPAQEFITTAIERILDQEGFVEDDNAIFIVDVIFDSFDWKSYADTELSVFRYSGVAKLEDSESHRTLFTQTFEGGTSFKMGTGSIDSPYANLTPGIERDVAVPVINRMLSPN